MSFKILNNIKASSDEGKLSTYLQSYDTMGREIEVELVQSFLGGRGRTLSHNAICGR